MTKRPRPEECEIIWPVDSTQPDSKTSASKRPEVNEEGEESRGAPGSHPVGEKGATGPHTLCVDVACANVACAEVAVAIVAEANVSFDN